MAYLNSEFDASQVEPAGPIEPVPPGEYVAHIKASEMKPTKNGNGQYLQLDLEVLEPAEHKGKIIWERLNLDNPNETAVEIARKTLSAICHAVGVMKVRESTELHFKAFRVTVDVEKKEGYNPTNRIKAYKSVNADGAAASAPTGATSTAPAWSRK